MRTCSLCSVADTLGSRVNIHRVTRLTLFLTFGIIALHQARLPNLYIEGFVLLVLLVVNYFHLDGFTEGGGGGGRKDKRKKGKKGKKREGRTVRTGQAGNRKAKRKQNKEHFPQAPARKPRLRQASL